MTGGLIQLLARGMEDIYLIYDPQITFFKLVYKRYTNFAIEPIRQNFSTSPNFGDKVSCTIAKCGDLLNKMYLVITLPVINKFTDSSTGISNLNSCAWVKYIGFALIKTIEIEIAGKLIDRQYGDWLYIWHELTTKCNDTQFNKMVGNIYSLIEYSNYKDSYILYVPLYFWFNKNYGLSLPLIALEFSDVKINLEINSINTVLNLSPNYYIQIVEDVVVYKSGDILYQKNSTYICYIKFVYFDNSNGKRHLYYDKLDGNVIMGTTPIYDINNIYKITPIENINEFSHVNVNTNFSWINYISLNSVYLLCDYIYLDIDERTKFARSNHEYLIEQVQYDSDKLLVNNYNKIKLSFNQPCKEIIFRAVMTYIERNNINDLFNYSLDYTNTMNIFIDAELLLNGQYRMATRKFDYYNIVQPYQHHTKPAPVGVGVYSFCLYPEEYQPSGTCNFSKIDDITIGFTVDKSINYSNTASVRTYALSYNIFSIMNGLGGLIFLN